MAWTIRRFFWVHHRFRYGIRGFFLCLATAIAMGLTASAPFDGVERPGFGLDIASEELREMMHIRRQKMVTNAALSLRRLMRLFGHRDETYDVEVVGDDLKKRTRSLAMRPWAKTKASIRKHSEEKQLPRRPLLFTRAALTSRLPLHQSFSDNLQTLVPRDATTSSPAHRIS
jgi:hypothetical protein